MAPDPAARSLGLYEYLAPGIVAGTVGAQGTADGRWEGSRKLPCAVATLRGEDSAMPYKLG